MALDFKMVSLERMSEADRYQKNLQTLIGSVIGTIPGSRGFGLSEEFVDISPEDARNDFAEELDEAVETYIPEIEIDSVDYTADSEGKQILKVMVTNSEEYGEEDGEDD